MTTDAYQIPGNDGLKSSGAVGEVDKGRNEIVSALFHVNSQVVAGRLTFLSVVTPALVILRVTPLPV